MLLGCLAMKNENIAEFSGYIWDSFSYIIVNLVIIYHIIIELLLDYTILYFKFFHLGLP